MKFNRRLMLSVCVLNFLLVSGLMFSEDLNQPMEPAVNDIAIPEVQAPTMSTNGQDKLVLLKATAVFSGGQTWKGLIYLTNNTQITITNLTASGIEIKSLSFYNIEKVRITKWSAEKTDKGDLYQFSPSEYRIVGIGTDTNGLVYKGNLPVFNQFLFSDDRVKKPLYTIFFDKWIEGKKGYFRWENSRADSFSYNFDNPISGVVTAIEFDRNF